MRPTPRTAGRLRGRAAGRTLALACAAACGVAGAPRGDAGPAGPGAAGAPPAGGAPEDPARAKERERIAAGLARARDFAERGRRVVALERELADALADEKAWVQAGILLVELAELEDRRAVAPLGRTLADKRPVVQAIAAHGLARYGAEDLRRGGGQPLAQALLGPLEGKTPFARRVARELLTRLAGEDLGPKASKWKRWAEKDAAALPLEPPPFPFDEAAHDAALVAEARAAAVASGSTVRARIPPVTSEIRELNERGLDVAILLDQTGSMGAVIDACKARVDLLTEIVGLVVPDCRFGLVTYDDGVRAREPLHPRGARLAGVLQKVVASGGGDFEEGIDKALDWAAKPEFGWRKRSVKAVLVLGDAPLHDPDLPRTLELLGALHERLGVTTHMISTTPSPVRHFPELAKRGGGRSLEVSDPARLVSEVLVLVMGEALRPAMERFVPVLMEVTAERGGGG